MSDLIERLRGNYPIGPIMENGAPEFGWRKIDYGDEFTPAIQFEAATELTRLRVRVAELEKIQSVIPILSFPSKPRHFLNMTKPMC